MGGEHIWSPSKKKYGVAICNYKSSNREVLNLFVGETVHIIEEYGSGPDAWYRGTSFKQKGKMGIFPACLIHIKPCKVDNEGFYETIYPDEDNMVKEVAYVLREWSSILKTIYVRDDPLYRHVICSMEELIKLRGQLVEKKLTSEDDREIKKDIVGVIDWGNGKLGMDLVPRIDGEQVDADNCSIVRLHRVHEQSAQVANNPGPHLFMRKDSGLRGDHGSTSTTTHHLLANFKNFGCNVGDLTETLLSIHTYKDGKSVCLTEKFLVQHTKNSAPVDIAKLNNINALFTDLTHDDLEKDLYLVAHIYRIGRMLQENKEKKSSHVSFKRPWGVGVESLTKVVGMPLSKLPNSNNMYEFTMKITFCADSELQFPNLQDQIIRKLQAGGSTQLNTAAAKLGLCLTIATRLLHGDLATVKKEDPMLFNKGVTLVQKLGVSDIITPVAELMPTLDGPSSEVRNDLYVTLKEADFKRGSKKAEKNVELKVTVYDKTGKQIQDCISYGCGDTARSEYYTSVYYHCNRPEWNETIRLSVPIDVFPGSHICFELFHCSVRKGAKKPFGFAFVRVTNEMQIVIRDATHDLCVYKYVKWHTKSQVDEKDTHFDMKKYLNLPFLIDDLNDPSNINRIPKNLMFKANERESLTITTMLCSGKFTQNGDLLGILNWRGDRGKISENLQKLCRMQGEEIVKFLHDILDALFELLVEEKDREDLSHQIFHALVTIFTLIHHQRFETFKPILDAYISEVFAAPLVHKPMCVCFSEMVERAKEGGKTNLQLIQAFQAMDYIFSFIVQSREIQRKYAYSHAGGDEIAFKRTIEQLFLSMGHLLGSKSERDVLKSYQVTLLTHLDKVYEPLLQLMSEQDVCLLISTCLSEMAEVNKLHDEITHVLLELLRKTVNTHLFQADESRSRLLPLCLEKVATCLKWHIQLKLAVDLLGDIMDNVYNLKQTSNIKGDIQILISKMFDVVMETIMYMNEKTPCSMGAVISCLIEMIHLMEEEHYDALLHVYNRGPNLKQFLIRILEVFRLLVKPDIFPGDWTVMRMVTNNVVFTAVEYLSQAIKDKYSSGDNFSLRLWSSYFNLAIAFISQPSLQLEQYSEAKAQKLKERYQDMRVLMGLQVTTHWQSLGSRKQHFIPTMVGPFLELTLVPERDLRKVTLPIIFDMMEVEQRTQNHFKEVEEALIERLDHLVTIKKHGDEQYKDLFKKILLERVQHDDVLKETGPRFITSITDLLERLLDYRQMIDGEENKDKRMHCTFNILNFYKDEINREEMYVRYVNKLHELHNLANNHVEAGLTLQLYAKMLSWGDKQLPREMRYEEEPECKRKEMLYTQIINCFDKGKVWEYALPLCKDLAAFYESKLDYKKLGDILKLQASFYQKILEGVPGEDPSQPDLFFPRQDPSYYLVAYYGQTFPAFVRNKQFIYRGDECLRLPTIMNHLNAEFPTAQILTKTSSNLEELKQGDQQYFQIWSVKPISEERPEFQGKVVPTEIRNFYSVNDVDTFELRRPFHRGEVDKNNECKTLCIGKTKLKTAYKFPGILRWYEVVHTEEETLCPISVAMDTIKDCNADFVTLLNRCNSNPKLYFTQLEMKLNGVISAAVSGGISKYHEAFYTRQYELEYPEEAEKLADLSSLLREQLDILAQCMKLHGNLVPDDLRPLHKNLETDYKKMKQAVTKHSHRSTISTTSNLSIQSRIETHGSSSTLGYSSDRSSIVSHDEEFLGVTHPNDLPNQLLPPERPPHYHHGNHDAPPPVPTRPRSVVIAGPVGQAPARPPTSFGPPNRGLSGSLTNLTETPHGGRHYRRDKNGDRSKTQPIPALPQPLRRPSDPTHSMGASLVSPKSPVTPRGTKLTVPDGEIPQLPQKQGPNRTSKTISISPAGSQNPLAPGDDLPSSDTVPPLPPRKTSFPYNSSRSRNSEISPTMPLSPSSPQSIRSTIIETDPTSAMISLSPNSSQIFQTTGQAPPPIPVRRADSQQDTIPPIPSPRHSNESRNSNDSGFSN